jgi:hypothetical protein
MVEKHGHGYPWGSNNKPKSIGTATTSSPILARCRPSRPLGSKNKKSSIATVDTIDHLDVSVAHHTLPSSSLGNLFSFLAFAGAQCHEQQYL